MKTVIALVLGLGVAHAQPKPDAKAPPTAKTGSLVEQVLAKVEANYKQPQHFSASFDQTVTRAIGGAPAASLGSIRIEKPNKLRVEYLQPKRATPKPKMTYLLDGTSMHVIDHPNMRYGKRSAADSELPALVSFFLGQGTLTKEFQVALTADKTYVPAGATALELTPKKPNAATARVILILDKASRVERSLVFNSTGDIQEMRFKDVVLDKPAPAGTFVHDPKRVAGFEPLK